MVDDTQNRLNALFDSLNAQTVESQAVLNNLRNISQALAGQDYNTAMKITLEIMGSGEADMRWALGLKQLMRLTGQA